MKAKSKDKMKTKPVTKSKPTLSELAPKKKKKKSSFFKILATTIGLLGVASAVMLRKEKSKGTKRKTPKRP